MAPCLSYNLASLNFCWTCFVRFSSASSLLSCYFPFMFSPWLSPTSLLMRPMFCFDDDLGLQRECLSMSDLSWWFWLFTLLLLYIYMHTCAQGGGGGPCQENFWKVDFVTFFIFFIFAPHLRCTWMFLCIDEFVVLSLIFSVVLSFYFFTVCFLSFLRRKSKNLIK